MVSMLSANLIRVLVSICRGRRARSESGIAASAAVSVVSVTTGGGSCGNMVRSESTKWTKLVSDSVDAPPIPNRNCEFLAVLALAVMEIMRSSPSI